jgi:bromodomain-containing factor 1
VPLKNGDTLLAHPTSLPILSSQELSHHSPGEKVPVNDALVSMQLPTPIISTNSTSYPIEPTVSDVRETPEPISREAALANIQERQDLEASKAVESPSREASTQPSIPPTSSESTNLLSSNNNDSSNTATTVEAMDTSQDSGTSPGGAVTAGVAHVDLKQEPSNVAAAFTSSEVDSEMPDADAPTVSTKLVREREDDEFPDGPLSKRTKTDEEEALGDFKVPQTPAIPGVEPLSKDPKYDVPMTGPQHKYLLKELRNIKRTNDAKPFIAPVDAKALNIPTYFDIIKHPMHLKKVEDDLKDGKYATIASLLADLDLVINNCITFNGVAHVVTKMALNLRSHVKKSLEHLPPADQTELTAADKKAQKAAAAAASSPKAAPRRASRVVGAAQSPPAVGTAGSPSATTFPVNPATGVPVIRRDSNVLGDGRPKREIHPPAPRDLPYSGSKPRKKKFQAELKFCEDVLKELAKTKHWQYYQYFNMPVDPVAMNIPTYHKVIKKPMDFQTITTKMGANEYQNAAEFEADVRLIFQNCYKFNKPGEPVNQFGHQLESVFDEEWAKKKAYLIKHGAHTPESDENSDDEDASEEEEDSEDEIDNDHDAKVALLQKQLQDMSQQLLSLTGTPAASAGKKKIKSEKKIKGEKKTKVKKETGKAKAKKEKKSRTPYVTFEEKQEISERINTLPQKKMMEALKIIRENMPQLGVSIIHDRLLTPRS